MEQTAGHRCLWQMLGDMHSLLRIFLFMTRQIMDQTGLFGHGPKHGVIKIGLVMIGAWDIVLTPIICSASCCCFCLACLFLRISPARHIQGQTIPEGNMWSVHFPDSLFRWANFCYRAFRLFQPGLVFLSALWSNNSACLFACATIGTRDVIRLIRLIDWRIVLIDWYIGSYHPCSFFFFFAPPKQRETKNGYHY